MESDGKQYVWAKLFFYIYKALYLGGLAVAKRLLCQILHLL